MTMTPRRTNFPKLLRNVFVPVTLAFACVAAVQGEPMPKKSKTLCVGRYLVDVPQEAVPVGREFNYRWDDISVTQGGKRDDFQRALDGRVETLRATKHEADPSLLKRYAPDTQNNSAVLVYWENKWATRQYQTEAFKWSGATQFRLKGRVSVGRLPIAMEIVNHSLSKLRARKDNEIPTTPGFCIEGGFFAGEPEGAHFEEADMFFSLKEHPDVRFRINTRMNGTRLEESLLTRLGKVEIPAVLKPLAAQMRTVRQGEHAVGILPGEESLDVVPAARGLVAHVFAWESPGKPKDWRFPSIFVSLDTGTLDSGERVTPSLTDKQAVELFDSIVNSIRLRPTTPTADLKAAPPEKPAPTASKPAAGLAVLLGTQLSSDSPCPQAGLWQCDQTDALGGNQRFFPVGAVLPPVLVPVPLSLWQRLQGVPPNQMVATTWTLVGLPG